MITALFVCGLIGSILVSIFWYQKHKMQKYFNQKFQEFNQNRVNPLTKEAYFDFFQLEHKPINFLGMHTLISIKDANHRNGDELILNSTRDAKTRIKDHLKLSNHPKNSIISLGYDFKDKNNLIEFISLLKEVVPEGSQISFPVNKEWFVFQKNENSIGISFKP